MNPPALLIIDMQQRWINDRIKLFPDAASVILNINRLRSHFQTNGFPVIHAVMEHAADGSTLAIDATEPWNVKGSAEAKIVDDLAPSASEIVVSKSRYSSFFNTDLKSKLSSLHVGEVLLTGYQLRSCVLATCFDVYQNDFPPMVISDAVLETEERYFGMHLELFDKAEWLCTTQQWLDRADR